MANHATYGSVCVLAAAMLWGTTGTAAALAPGVGSLAVGAAAMGIGGLLQAAAALRGIRAHRIGLAAQWKVLTMSALATAIYPLAFYSSMRLAGVAVGTVVSIGSAPAASAVIERIADKQGLSRRWAFGAAVGVGGVLLLAAARTGGEHNGVAAVGTHPVTGILLGLLAGLTYALYSWGAARMMRPGLPPRPVMGAIFGIAAIPLLPILILTGAPIIADAQNLAAVAYLAVVPMFLGYLLFGKGLAAVSASTATTLTLLESAVAALMAVMVLHEHLPILGWLGMALLFASLAILTTQPTDPERQSVTAIPACAAARVRV
jgi:drug/metabolite transporter, DME family